MKIETTSERRARILAEAKEQGKQIPGRTLPKGYQWNGLDQPGGGAVKRRLRQAEQQQEKADREVALRAVEGTVLP